MIKRLFYKVYMFFEEKKVWKAKMSEPIKFRLVEDDTEYIDATDDEVSEAFKSLISQYGDVLEKLAKH